MTEQEGRRFSLILWQLQQYQHIIRSWDRHLDPYEFKAVMQILDRTVGWQREEATFRPHVMLNGDRKYSGFGNTMSRSKLMEVLRQLEDRGVIERRPDPSYPGLKSYWLNLEWNPDATEGEGNPAASDVETGNMLPETVSTVDEDVSMRHETVPNGDYSGPIGDPREAYQDNAILTGIQENTIRVDPRPAASDQRAISSSSTELSGETVEPFQSNPAIDPPPRRRRA